MRIVNKLKIAAAVAALIVSTPLMAQVKVALDSPKTNQSGTYVWAHAFTEHLKANGMNAEEYERGALGGEAEKLDQVSQGLLEVSLSDVKSAAGLDGTVFGLFLPYFFKDAAEIEKALYVGGMLEKINKKTTAKGVRVASIVHLGGPAGIFTTKKSVKTMADMNGLRMRALDEAQIAIFKSWGAQGTIVAWNEVPNALQTGVADGYLNPSFVPLLFGHTGFIKHFTDAAVAPSTRAALISEDWYQGLSDGERKTVNDAIDAANKANLQWLAGQTSVLDQLKKQGVEVVELDDAARREFREASQKIWTTMPMPEGALDAWKAAIK
ncbi:MAG: TRAP transporter substrate-binding protein [Pseudomonadota bacterium]